MRGYKKVHRKYVNDEIFRLSLRSAVGWVLLLQEDEEGNKGRKTGQRLGSNGRYEVGSEWVVSEE